jgi:hypothetical protein
MRSCSVEEQRLRVSSEDEGPDTDFKYLIDVRAFETLRNVLRREGVSIPEGSNHISFTWHKRLNMKALKESGMIWSYSIIRVRKVEEIIEES